MKNAAKKDKSERKRRGKFRRARARRFLFTVGPDRLSGGRLGRAHRLADPRLHEVEVLSPLWPSSYDGVRIGHVSDFHLGDLHPVAGALDALHLLAAAEPDLVACTGDVVDLECVGAEPVFEALASIDAPLGVYLVLGNHDHLDDGRAIARQARAAGVQVLENETVQVNHNGASLVVSGIDWAPTKSACAKAVERTCDVDTHLLLSHSPRAFATAANMGIAMTLAGHTHGGQVALPRRPKMNFALTHRHSAGLFERRGSHMYVTNGVGSWFPLRMNCPAEVAMITMRSAGRGLGLQSEVSEEA